MFLSESSDILEIWEQKTMLICTTELFEKCLVENTSKIVSIQEIQMHHLLCVPYTVLGRHFI